MLDHLFDHRQIAARGERLALASHKHRADPVVPVGVPPDFGQLAVADRIHRVQPTGCAHRHLEHTLGGPVDPQPLVPLVSLGHPDPPAACYGTRHYRIAS